MFFYVYIYVRKLIFFLHMNLKHFKNQLKILNKKSSGILLLLSICSLFGVGFSSWILVNENENSMSFNVDGTVGDVLDLRGIAALNGAIDVSNYSASGFIVNNAISNNGYVTCPITFSPIEGFTSFTLYPELTPSNSSIISFIKRCAYSLDAKFDATDSFMNRTSSARGSFSYTSSSLSTSFYIIFEIGAFDENLLSYIQNASFSFSLSIGVDTNA